MNKDIRRFLVGVILLNLLIINLTITSLSNPLDDYINISVEEAWEMLRSTENGFQIPIDVRTDVEWETNRIDTPYPEFPRQFVLDQIQDEESYQTFLELYDGNDVVMYCKAGARSATAAMVLVSRGFNGTVYNVAGGITEWETKGLPLKKGNDAPEKPSVPTGSSVCTINEIYSFSSSTTDNNDDVIRLGFDWNNDENIDNWSDYYPSNTVIEMEHSWSIDSNFNIRVIAEDHVGHQSELSDPLEITINNPPSIPQIQGPTDGAIDEEYEYEFISNDLDLDQIYYYIEWGDDTNTGWIGPYQEGEIISSSHIWENKGSYTIRVKVKDDYDAESDWGSFQVSMPKSKSNMKLIEYIYQIIHVFKELIKLNLISH